MRDLLFTCSSIDFGYHVSRPSKQQDPSFPGVRLYDLNQSMLTPMFHGAGMPWLGTIHGSDLDYLFNNAFSKTSMSESDQKLSDYLQACFINFAYTGDPNQEVVDGGASLWPEAFPEGNGDITDDAETSQCSSINFQVIGGLLGTGSCHLTAGIPDKMVLEDAVQSPLVDSVQYEEMRSGIAQERQNMLEQEKLLERCAFINSLAEKLGH